jgi:hypothetical protein
VALFPPPPEANLTNTADYDHPEPIQVPLVTKEEVARAVMRAAPLKAPGLDGIPNIAIQRALTDSAIPDTPFNACFSLGYCRKHFHELTTVVIHKPREPDYTAPKAYRPIALLSVIGKAVEAVITPRLSYLVEAVRLLPVTMSGANAATCVSMPSIYY